MRLSSIAIFVSLIVGMILTTSIADAQPAGYVPGWKNSDGTYKAAQLVVRRGRCPGYSFSNGITCGNDHSYSTGIPVVVWSIPASLMQTAGNNNSRINLGTAYLGFRMEESSGYNPGYNIGQYLYFNAQVWSPDGTQMEWLATPILTSQDQHYIYSPSLNPSRYICPAMLSVIRPANINGCLPCSQLGAYTSPRNLGDHAAVFLSGIRYAGSARDAYDRIYNTYDVSLGTMGYGGSRVRNTSFVLNGIEYISHECDLRMGDTGEHPASFWGAYIQDVTPLYPSNTFTDDKFTWIDRQPVHTIMEGCPGVDTFPASILPRAEFYCM